MTDFRNGLMTVLKMFLLSFLMIVSTGVTFAYFGNNVDLFGGRLPNGLSFIVSGCFGVLNADIGALIWLQVFLFGSRGTAQRVVAALMLFVSLSVAALTTWNAMQESFGLVEVGSADGALLAWLIVAMTVLQVTVGIFAFTILDPDNLIAIEVGAAMSQVVSETIENVKVSAAASKEAQAQHLADEVWRTADQQIRTALGSSRWKFRPFTRNASGEQASQPEA